MNRGGKSPDKTTNQGDSDVTQEAQDGRSLAERKIHEDFSKGSQKLILENFKLQDLAFMNGVVWDSLFEIDLHKNFLLSIDVLNQFRNLRVIKASDNYIQEITLNLQRLEDLDLHNNYINKFPLLNQLPKIQKLNLNGNKIAEFRVEFKAPSSLSLQYLDIGTNLIDFASSYEFYDFLEKLKKLKNLKQLVVTNNPFGDENKFDQIVSQMPTLDMFNFEKAEEYRKQAMEDDKKGKEPAVKKGDKRKQGRGKQKVDKTIFYFPTLELLCYNLEAANSHPSYALDHLKDLAQDVDKIAEHLEMVDEYIAKGKNEVEINDMIEDFMQNAQLLIDNNFELQAIMLTILSKLSIIKYYDFGVRCFNTLKDLMIAGREMEERVIDILEKEVINKLEQQNPEMIPASLLKGLFELVKQTEQADMLTGLYENCFPQWLRRFLERINACKRIQTIFEDNAHFDSIIALMSVSLKDCKINAELATKKELIPIIAEILDESTWENNRYINLLRIVENICKQNVEAANQFIDKTVHNNILKNIRQSMHIYKKNNDLKDEDSKDTEEKVKAKYLTLAAEIDALGGLLEAERGKRIQIINDPVLEEMLQITSHYKTDPVLLTSLQPKIKKMQNLVQLIPYLGLKKYEDALKMARRYYDPTSFADKEKATSLAHLDDVVVQEMFIAIINLINFFCEEAAKLGSAPIFEEVSQSLNDNSRETALFNCLEVPNDDVKLAVVECLNNVPLSEFDTEEIATIIRLLGQYKNIGAGKTEYVLAKIFWILTKLTKDKESDSGQNFRLKFGEKAVAEALDILIRNQMRFVEDPEEEQEKLALSISCVHFLKFCSINPDLKKNMANRHDEFKRALYADENCTRYHMTKYPIELEMTWIGRNMDVLIYAVTGVDSIEPYNIVSFRVLQRMADVLMNKIDVDAEDPFLPGIDVIEHLKVHYKQNMKRRKEQERTYWEDPPQDFVSKMQYTSQEQFNAFFQQHYLFTSNNGIPLIRMFLTKKVPEFEQYLKKEYSQEYDARKLKLEKHLQDRKTQHEISEQEKQRKEEEKKGKSAVKKSNKDDMDDEESGINLLRMALQQEELGQNYDQGKNQDHFIQSAKTKNQNQENIEKRDNKSFGVQDNKIRSLCIAAYLRCLFATIEYAPNRDLKAEAIRNLKDEFVFRNITQLCDTTGWFEANVGAKYLRVMRHIIKVPFTEGQEEFKNLQLYEIIAVVIRKILSLLMIRIKNEQQKPLSNEDKVLIYELASTCQLICNQCSLFRWSSMEVKQVGQHSRTRRTPQEKLIDHQISELFPSQSILTFISILFRDMNLAYKVYDSESKPNPDEIEIPYIKDKINSARELIKVFLGEYLSKCKDNKYDILEAIMKGMVFEKRRLRESYLQEILKSLQHSLDKAALEQYIFDKKMGFEVDSKERINCMVMVDLVYDANVAYKPRLLVLTNKGVHILKASGSKPCSVCPPENLCPEGPKTEFKFKYDRIIEIVTFPDLPQKLLFVFQQNMGLMKKEQNLYVCAIIPGVSQATEMITYLQEILEENQPINTDQMFRGAIDFHLGDEDLRLARYVSFNPSKSIFSGLWSEEMTISSCVLLAISGGELVMLKENWSKWLYIDDDQKIKAIIERMKNRMDKEASEGQSMAQRQEEFKVQQAITGALQEVQRRSLGDIENLHVHKGKDPVVEIQFGRQIDKMIFQCDFGRQQFIEALIEIKTGRANNNDDGYE